MRRKPAFHFLEVLLATLVLAVWAGSSLALDSTSPHQAPGAKPAIPENYNCITCHKDMDDEVLTPPVNDWMESVHREVGIKCADCHGGDPFDEDNAMEPAKGFVGKPKPADIPKFCARCHSDAKRMRAYNQRSDEYALYTSGIHGRKLLSGDKDAPTCVDCHGKHRILRAKDPKSTVFRKNIPETCGSCHSKKEIFRKRRKPFNQLTLYKKSSHYEKFAQGNLLVPTCVDCHGKHNIARPTSDRVRKVCFSCHPAQAEYYKQSPHWKAYRKQGEPICLNCHNNHDVTKPLLADFTGDRDIDCAGCHDENEPAYKKGQRIQQAVAKATTELKTASTALEKFQDEAHGGFDVSDLMGKIKKANEGLTELNALTHKLDVDAIKSKSRGLALTASMVNGKVAHMRSEIRTRKVALAVAWLVFFGFAGTLWMKSGTMRRRDDDQ